MFKLYHVNHVIFSGKYAVKHVEALKEFQFYIQIMYKNVLRKVCLLNLTRFDRLSPFHLIGILSNPHKHLRDEIRGQRHVPHANPWKSEDIFEY